jgi:Ca2+:H+ antiporter
MSQRSVRTGQTAKSAGNWWQIIEPKDQRILLIAVGITVLALILVLAHVNSVVVFIITAAALALLASVVGMATEQLGSRMGAGATGVLQSALGNLPELFVGIFALRAGLVTVIQSALIGSILGNSLLVLGLAFVVGGIKHGTQRFTTDAPRMMAVLTLLAVAALIVPTLTQGLHTPASSHEGPLSIICAIVLLVIFVASIPVAMQGGPTSVTTPPEGAEALRAPWPLALAGVLLALAAVGSAFVSDWFINALTPAIAALHLTQAFTGLVIVALAGNAVENVVGIQFALRNQQDYAISIIMNSSLQVALGLIPVLVLLSFAIGGAHLLLVLPPLLVVALALSAILGAIVVYDGESTWLEGLALIGLYVMIAVSFWWG